MNISKIIIQEPDERLHQVSVKVSNTKEAKKIATKLIDVTRIVDQPWKIWIAMAAPQIGYNKRLILLRRRYHNYKVMVNPEIIEKSWLFPSIETCYSLRGKGFYFLKRFFKLKMKYRDLTGKLHQGILIGPQAYSIQQEIDHLNGILVSDIGRKIT